jgi:hypothetical protein
MEVFNMIKFKQGWIGNNEGVTKDIVVKAAAPNTLKDALIGGGIVLVGVAYLTVTAFRHGVNKYEAAENLTLSELGLIHELRD